MKQSIQGWKSHSMYIYIEGEGDFSRLFRPFPSFPFPLPSFSFPSLPLASSDFQIQLRDLGECC